MKQTSRTFLKYTALAVTAFSFTSVVEAGRIIWPCTGSVTSPYGPRSSPCSGCSTFHHGIDIGVGTGTDLGSPGNGTVTSYAFDSCGGNIFTIGYGNGWQTRFLHCSARVAAVGSAVTRNQHVAESGNTGSCTTGAHLHFEVRKDGVSQGIPGSAGTWVTRNTEIPQDYPGLNDAPPPPAPPPFGNVSVLRFSDGRRALFAVARGNGSVWTSWQTSPGSVFVPWVSLGGTGFIKVQAFFMPGSEAMVLYGCGNGGALWQTWQSAPGSSWSAWTSLGGTITDFDVVYGNNNLPVAFAVSAGGLWHKWQTVAGGSWSAWTSLGGSGFTKIQGYFHNGLFTVYGCGNGSPLWQSWQSVPGGSWSALTSLGGSIRSFEVVKSSTNLPIAYAIGADTGVHTNWQPSAGASWNGWVSLGGSGHSRLDADILPNGAGIFFSMGEGSPVWQRWQSAPGSSWSAWTNLGGAMSTIAASRAPDGAFSLFAHGSGNSNIWNSWQTAPGTTYAPWVGIGSGF